jgi:hypothetical protein
MDLIWAAVWYILQSVAGRSNEVGNILHAHDTVISVSSVNSPVSCSRMGNECAHLEATASVILRVGGRPLLALTRVSVILED